MLLSEGVGKVQEVPCQFFPSSGGVPGRSALDYYFYKTKVILFMATPLWLFTGLWEKDHVRVLCAILHPATKLRREIYLIMLGSDISFLDLRKLLFTLFV